LHGRYFSFKWADIKQDLKALQETVIEENSKSLAVRSQCLGTCGRVFQAVGVALPQKFKLLPYRFPCIGFYYLHDLSYAVFRRKTQHNVNMIRLDISLHILYLRIPLAYLVHLLYQVFIHYLYEYLIPIPRYPYHMVHAPVYTVGVSPYFHAQILSY